MSSVNQLLSALGRQREARPRELLAQLGISSQMLSRLVTAAGERVCRMGKGRATRYALTRSYPGLGTRLALHQVTESGTLRAFGTLHLLSEGGHWLEREEGSGRRFEGLPPFAADMSPQGYIGRNFTAHHPELGLPADPRQWNDDQRLLALALRGEHCVGDVIIGRDSLNRFLADVPRPVSAQDYPHLARTSASGQPGSSAGGEQPKFTAYAGERHVLVKFARGADGAAALRWRELLACEHRALAAVRAAGFHAASSRVLEGEGYRFLEVERFDRVGPRGRRAMLSLGAIADEYFGDRDTWTLASLRLRQAGFIDEDDARRMRWLDAFGQLIGNTDRHFGNLSFFVEDGGDFIRDKVKLRLAPVYDMLPMVFAPSGAMVVERTFTPAPPTADNLDVWSHAARCAVAYWRQLVETRELSAEFRERCARGLEAVETLVARSPSL